MPANRSFKTVGLFGKYQHAGMGQVLMELASFMQNAGYRVIFDSTTANNTGLVQNTAIEHLPINQIGSTIDVAVIVGGDGTLLWVARELAAHEVPLIGINHGRVGFLTDIALGDWKTTLKAMLDGPRVHEPRIMLQGKVLRGNEVMFEAIALNDVVISRAGVAGMIEFAVDVNGLRMSQQRADGLIVCTPTGSTAYALSANGPILHPQLAGIALVPVAPQALSNRPIVIPQDVTIQITLTRSPGGRDASAAVHFDMQSWSSLREGDVIEVSRGDHTVHLLHPLGYSVFATLRRKLAWSLMPEQA